MYREHYMLFHNYITSSGAHRHSMFSLWLLPMMEISGLETIKTIVLCLWKTPLLYLAFSRCCHDSLSLIVSNNDKTILNTIEKIFWRTSQKHWRFRPVTSTVDIHLHFLVLTFTRCLSDKMTKTKLFITGFIYAFMETFRVVYRKW
jgi:hypothetical protein